MNKFSNKKKRKLKIENLKQKEKEKKDSAVFTWVFGQRTLEKWNVFKKEQFLKNKFKSLFHQTLVHLSSRMSVDSFSRKVCLMFNINKYGKCKR